MKIQLMSKGKHGVITHRSNEEPLKRGKGREHKEFLLPYSCWLIVALLLVALKKCISFAREVVDKCCISNAVVLLGHSALPDFMFKFTFRVYGPYMPDLCQSSSL